ncbi:MAG: MFS transporter [Acidobacteriota bacterium]|nr:MFS transporter [Acidobacteriota bacterium]
MSEPEIPRDAYAALRHGEFRWFMAATLVLSMAMQMQSVIMGWQVYEITRDPLSLGFVGLAEALPFLATTLIGGHAADLRDRRLLCLVSELALLGGASVLLLLNLHGAPSQAWPFYVVQAVAGLGRAFYRPAAQALAAEIVPREIYANAAAWRSSVFHAAMVLGPALGGLIYGFGSARAAYAVEAFLLLSGLAATFALAPRPRPAHHIEQGPGFFDGVRFVFHQKLVLGALTLDLFAVLFGGAPALLPIFADQILKVGPQGLGILRAAPAVGSVAMSFALAHLPELKRAGRTLLLCVGAFGLCWVAFAFSKSFWLSLALLALSGALDDVSVVIRSTLVQTLTPPHLMGRVSAVNAFFIGSSNELGAFESGLAARLLGLVPSVVAGGLMTLGVVGAMAWRMPDLRRLKRLG